MGMLGTLAKVAIGIAVAKGIGGMMKGRQSPGGSIPQGGQPSPSGGGSGLEDIMGDMLSGGRRSGQSSGMGKGKGGLGDLLEQLGGGLTSGKSTSGGGLGDLIGDLAGGKTRGDDDLGNIFGDFLGSGQSEPEKTGDSFGDIFNDSIARGGEPATQPTRQQEAAAALMLRAMIQAAKSDGKIDQAERSKLLENLGDVSREEREFVNREMQSPVDVRGLAGQVPPGLEQQVYLMSVVAINLDNRNEAQYLHELATELDIDRESVNEIHEHVGVTALYS